MTVEQSDAINKIARTLHFFEGYENSKIAAVRQSDGEQDGDTILMVNGEVGDVPVRIKPDGTMFDLIRREVTLTEVLKQIQTGIQVSA